MKFVLEQILIILSMHISQTLYLDMVSKVHLFKGCSEDFLSQIVRTSVDSCNVLSL
jgi:hypothetical protein